MKLLHSLDPYDWSRLLITSRAEGLKLVQRLLDDFHHGVNCFDAAGELLLAQVEQEVVIGVCGLNHEPDGSLTGAGRVRRLYVDPDHRRQGLATELVKSIIKHSREHFSLLTVNCGRLPVGLFYERCGFIPVVRPGITHILKLAG